MSFLEINGLKTHVQKIGSSDNKLVLIHGLVVDNLSSFYFTLANPIATKAEVLLYDLRGHGKTERPESGYTLHDLMRDLKGVIEQKYPGENVYLGGNSFGGLMALAFAKEYPGLVKGLVLIDPLLPTASWQQGMVDTLSQTGEQAQKMIEETYKDWHGRTSKRKSKTLADIAGALVGKTSLLNDILASADYTPEQLAQIKCPVLVFYGDHSKIIDNGHKLVDWLPNCELKIVPDCTHLVMFEGTGFLVNHIKDWLAKLS